MIAYKLVGMRRVIEEVSRIGSGPSFKTVGALEQVTADGFMATLAAVHVITGSLKGSGRTETEFDGTTWQGTILYGGPSPGPNNPVDYAIYELARGGDHYWFGVLDSFEQSYEQAVLTHFQGGA